MQTVTLDLDFCSRLLGSIYDLASAARALESTAAAYFGGPNRAGASAASTADLAATGSSGSSNGPWRRGARPTGLAATSSPRRI